MTKDDWDPLHSVSQPDLHWTTSNLGEAMPGVLTPLSWTLWAKATEGAAREAAFRVGALDASERPVAEDMSARAIRVFFGRPAMQVEFFAMLGDRMPGTTGRETVRSVFGRVPEDIAFAPTRRRYPVIAWRFPLAFVRTPGRIRALAAEQDSWYQREIAGVDGLDLGGARALFAVARTRLGSALTIQTVGFMAVIQPLFNGLVRLAEIHGFDDVNSLAGGGGGAELAVLTDIWEASQERLPLAEVQRSHGFHGPSEGELSSRVWRQDPGPLEQLVKEYRARGEEANPRQRERRQSATRVDVERRFRASLPALQRPIGVLLLRMAKSRVPLRGLAKRSFLQAFDIARATACRVGEILTEQGLLVDALDVFQLTVEELLGETALPGGEVIVKRHARRKEYQQVCLASEWTGQPAPAENPAATESTMGAAVEGIGVSAGVVEGVVRVVTSPDIDDVHDDEILVAPFTDPSWTTIMMLASALVVDIGGALSHAAVVARELGIPCVVNTRTGTRALHTGDRVRVDGTRGTVTVLRAVSCDG